MAGFLASMALPLLGNVVKSLAPGLISKVTSFLPGPLKAIGEAVLPGLVESGVEAVEKGFGSKSEGKSIEEKVRKVGRSFLKRAGRRGHSALMNVNRGQSRSVNNMTPVFQNDHEEEKPLIRYQDSERMIKDELDKIFDPVMRSAESIEKFQHIFDELDIPLTSSIKKPIDYLNEIKRNAIRRFESGEKNVLDNIKKKIGPYSI